MFSIPAVVILWVFDSQPCLHPAIHPLLEYASRVSIQSVIPRSWGVRPSDRPTDWLTVSMIKKSTASHSKCDKSSIKKSKGMSLRWASGAAGVRLGQEELGRKIQPLTSLKRGWRGHAISRNKASRAARSLIITTGVKKQTKKKNKAFPYI